MTVGHWHISAHICANPVSEILLVHRVLISVVLSGSWEINAHVFYIRLNTETKFGIFPSITKNVACWTWLVFEIKIPEYLVCWRCWSMLVRPAFIFTHWISKADAFLDFWRAEFMGPFWVVLRGANWFSFLIFVFIPAEIFNTLD